MLHRTRRDGAHFTPLTGTHPFRALQAAATVPAGRRCGCTSRPSGLAQGETWLASADVTMSASFAMRCEALSAGISRDVSSSKASWIA
jgi:hypothetical protein